MTTTSMPPLTVGEQLPAALRKKRVLLIDASQTKRDLRAESMRNLGVEVDIAADISEARSWWRADLYNLVLFDLENELGSRDKFCDDIRGANPPQKMAFFVGKPELLADFPNADSGSLVQDAADSTISSDTAIANDPSAVPEQRWGILEASRKISEVRSLSHARTKALRERPSPPRDSEMRLNKRGNASRTLDDLLRGEQ